MSARLTAATCLVAALAIFAACGGTPATGPDGPTTAPDSMPEPVSTEPADDPADTPDSNPEPAPTEATQPDGGAIDICALVTAAEWASVTGLNVTGAQDLEMVAPFQGCLYPTDGNPAGSTSLSPDGGMWDLVWIPSASQMPEIAGVGDGAVWDENSGSLVVLAGDHILSVNVGSGADDMEARLEWAKALAQIAVGRL
jgi:hypothetical protein